MFYCIYVFNTNIYYIQDEDAIVIFKQADKQLDVFDLISKKEVKINKILSKISTQTTNRIVFHFTPDDRDLNIFQKERFNRDDVLFVKTSGNNEFPSHIKHPLTAQA